MAVNEEDVSLLLKAVKFSAEKHRNQRRKGTEDSPYPFFPTPLRIN